MTLKDASRSLSFQTQTIDLIFFIGACHSTPLLPNFVHTQAALELNEHERLQRRASCSSDDMCAVAAPSKEPARLRIQSCGEKEPEASSPADLVVAQASNLHLSPPSTPSPLRARSPRLRPNGEIVHPEAPLAPLPPTVQLVGSGSPSVDSEFLVSAHIRRSRFADDFEQPAMADIIGRGAFGTVVRARNRMDDCVYAVKQIPLYENERDVNALILREVKALAKLDHPNIVRYFQSWMEEDDDERSYADLDILDGVEEQSTTSLGEPSQRDLLLDNSCSRSSSSDTSDLDDDSFLFMQQPIRGLSCAESSAVELLDSSNGGGVKVLKDHDDDNIIGIEEEEGPCASSLDSEACLNKSGPCSSSPRDGRKSRRHSSDASKGRRFTLFIQMQLCEEGNLRSWLDNRTGPVDLALNVHLLSQMVSGLAHVHRMGLIHRDLKPANIFMTSATTLRIGDFGLSKTCNGSQICQGAHSLEESCDSQHVEHTRVPSAASFSEWALGTGSAEHTQGVGSPLYCAPEQRERLGYSAKSDIFSLGIIFVEMNCCAFSTGMERVHTLLKAREGELPEGFLEAEPAGRDFTLSLLCADPSARPTANQILRSRFLMSVHYAAGNGFLGEDQIDATELYSLPLSPFDRPVFLFKAGGYPLASPTPPKDADVPALQAVPPRLLCPTSVTS